MAQGFIYDQYGNHASKHQDGGADEISVTGLSGLLADDQHILDPEVLALFAPWTDYTPTLTPNSGAFVNVSATGRYLTMGKVTFIKVNVSLTDVGTATAGYKFSLPNTPVALTLIVGRENGVTGKMLHAFDALGEANLIVQDYAGAGTIANGYNEFFNGCYENT